MDHSPGSVPSSDSSNKSTHSGYPPGTPKPPFEPPRRRSSLFFAKVLHHSFSSKTPAGNGKDSSERQKPQQDANLSNTGRKRTNPSLARSVFMPGHVAHMQKKFQNAKDLFRQDVQFAASPVGSIDSRLPQSPGTEQSKAADPNPSGDPEKEASKTPSKDWRYSRAPKDIAEFALDVREPFPEGSPRLPDLFSVEMDHGKVFAVEPPSSGFTSPVDEGGSAPHLKDIPNLSSDPAKTGLRGSTEKYDGPSPSGRLSTTDLERPLSKLCVSAEYDMEIDSAQESPIVIHLLRKSVESEGQHKESSSSAGEELVLAPTVRAAADSAKLKRGKFSDLFPKPPRHNGSDGSASATRELQYADVEPCPDPLLHARGPTVLCPDPAAHFRSATPNVPGPHGVSPGSNIQGTQGRQHGHLPGLGYPPPFNRATATGSPMPLLRAMSPATSTGQNGHNAWYPPPDSYQSRSYYPHHERLNRAYVAPASEHFQPGWYYARDSPGPSSKPGPPMYSFSTAAAKIVGRDPAPDSRIRDSYRTDTLTPLAKAPPSRFRKHGIIDLANARGVGKYYGGPSYLSRPPQRPVHPLRPARSHLPDDMRFRSSPPRLPVESGQRLQLKKRSRETETPTTEILEDEEMATESFDPKLKLEEGEEVIEVDEETQAAVRMSLFGAPAPRASRDAGRGIKDLSPNVKVWRKGVEPSVSRKKRRPSYWDGDLEEVMRSPAARHVVSSPIKRDHVRSERAEVEFQDDDADKENQMLLTEEELEDVSRVVEGPTILQEDVSMEH
ncbi:hypothetical protein AYL99_05940 [Fonsecaea erecta]|uniref:Uncharacterized protein n=1 Tax=Fonsecaea erecta TaxID=1367422 RepID=A0A178ZM99_9EURO|nr:hypothetical protein AYL99_05940 [Fonsecaea erecta]OAP60938.1 hypothetical protein AYL99_05940 [Fonsecaea erecta]